MQAWSTSCTTQATRLLECVGESRIILGLSKSRLKLQREVTQIREHFRQRILNTNKTFNVVLLSQTSHLTSGHPRTRRHLLGQRLLNKTLLLSLKLLFFSQLIKGTVLRLKTSGTNQVMISDDARCPPKARFGRRTGGARCADH